MTQNFSIFNPTKRLLLSIKRFKIVAISVILLLVLEVFWLAIYRNLPGYGYFGNESDLIETNFFKISFVLFLTCISSLMFKLTFERIKLQKELQWIGYVLSFIFNFIFIYFLFPSNGSPAYVTRYILGILILVLFYILVPFLNKQSLKSNQALWNYLQRAFTAFFLSLFAGIIITLGILLAFTLIGSLFGNEFMYGPLFTNLQMFFIIFLGTISTSLITLSLVPDDIYKEEFKLSVTAFLRILVLLILVPLVVIYELILYIYLLLTFLTVNIPSNVLAGQVIACLIPGYIIAFLTYHEVQKGENRFFSIFNKAFAISSLLLILVLFYSAIVRILEFGFTEERLLLIVVGSIMVCASLFIIFQKQLNLVFIGLIGLAIPAIALFTPFLNIYSLSYYSQSSRLVTTLKNMDIIVRDKFAYRERILDDNEYQAIQNIFYYLGQNHDLNVLESFMSGSDFTRMNVKKTVYEKWESFKDIVQIKWKYDSNYPDYEPIPEVYD